MEKLVFIDSDLYKNKLTEEFIRKYAAQLNWQFICVSQELSEKFICEFQDKVNWTIISGHQKLSEDFIREFQDKIDWGVSWFYKNNQMSEDFIREFQDKVNWKYVAQYQTLSEDFIREFKDKFKNKIDWFYITNRQNNLSEDFIKENLKKIIFKQFCRDRIEPLSWEFLSTYVKRIDIEALLLLETQYEFQEFLRTKIQNFEELKKEFREQR